MSTIETPTVALMGRLAGFQEVNWGTPQEKTYRCKVYLLLEDEGRYSVVAADLPGVASQGDSEEEALANIVEAFQGVMSSYRAHGTSIPWLPRSSEPERGALTRWVIVHV